MPSLREQVAGFLFGRPAPTVSPAQERFRQATERRLQSQAALEEVYAEHIARHAESLGGLADGPYFPGYGGGLTALTAMFGPGAASQPGAYLRHNYDRGRDATAYVTDQQLVLYREEARILYRWNDYYAGAIDRLKEYTVGKGFSWTVRRKGVKSQAASSAEETPPDVTSAQEAIDNFRVADKWRTRGQEIVERYHKDGDVFVRIFRGEYGQLPRVRFVEPEHVIAPPGQEGPDHWAFGVLNEPGDSESRLAIFYAPKAVAADGVVVPFEGADLQRVRELSPGLKIGTGRVLALAANVGRTSKRGLPSLLATGAGLERARKLIRNVVDTASYQATFALIRTHAQGTESTITDFQSRATNGATVRTMAVSQNGPQFRDMPAATADAGPKVVDATDALTYAPGPVSTGVPSFLAGHQAQLRAAGCKEAMPEYMISADASNANFASTKEAGTPFVVARESDQQLFADFECDIARVILRLACETSAAQADPDQLDIDVTPPGVAMQSDIEKEQVNEIRLRTKTTSPQEVIRERGGDPQHVASDLQTWDDQFPDAAAGKLPGFDDIGFNKGDPGAT